MLVSIADTGHGVTVSVDNDGDEIPPQVLSRIFERFYRADKSRARPESDSTGLGLAITKAIVVAHGGSIAVSRVGGRTRFALHFARRPEAGAAPH